MCVCCVCVCVCVVRVVCVLCVLCVCVLCVLCVCFVCGVRVCFEGNVDPTLINPNLVVRGLFLEVQTNDVTLPLLIVPSIVACFSHFRILWLFWGPQLQQLFPPHPKLRKEQMALFLLS